MAASRALIDLVVDVTPAYVGDGGKRVRSHKTQHSALEQALVQCLQPSLVGYTESQHHYVPKIICRFREAWLGTVMVSPYT